MLSCDSPLRELVRQTKRYAIVEVEPGIFEVIDHRYRLDQLLRDPDLRPTSDEWAQLDFDELLEALSDGPTLTWDDELMLGLLESLSEKLDGECGNRAFHAPRKAAVVFRGTHEQVEYFIRAALDHRR